MTVRNLCLVSALTVFVAGCGDATPNPRVFEIEAPPAGPSRIPVPLDEWSQWSVSPDGRWVAASPSPNSVGGWVLDVKARTFVTLDDRTLVRASRVITFDAGQRAYADHVTGAAYELPAAEPVLPRDSVFLTSDGWVAARLASGAAGEPTRLLVWHRDLAVTWHRDVGLSDLDVGAALSPDGSRLALVEETPDDRLMVTLFDARDGREHWRKRLDDFRSAVSTPVTQPIMFSPDGAMLFVGGGADRQTGRGRRWIELVVATGAARRETAVDLLGGSTEGVNFTAGVVGSVLWASEIARFAGSHTSPGIKWSCEYRRARLGRDELPFEPEKDAKLERLVTGTSGQECPTRAVVGNDAGGLTAVKLVGGKIRVVTWSRPPS